MSMLGRRRTFEHNGKTYYAKIGKWGHTYLGGYVFRHRPILPDVLVYEMEVEGRVWAGSVERANKILDNVVAAFKRSGFQ